MFARGEKSGVLKVGPEFCQKKFYASNTQDVYLVNNGYAL
jgi:hypothetical protein